MPSRSSYSFYFFLHFFLRHWIASRAGDGPEKPECQGALISTQVRQCLVVQARHNPMYLQTHAYLIAAARKPNRQMEGAELNLPPDPPCRSATVDRMLKHKALSSQHSEREEVHSVAVGAASTKTVYAVYQRKMTT